MLVDDIKARTIAALKAKRDVEKEVLRVALGEIQTAAARSNKPLSDDEAGAIVRKLIKSNRETLELARDDEQRGVLSEEIQILESLLPKALTEEEIVDALGAARDAIRGAANDGQATGVAMKHLKAQGASVDGKRVAAAVKKIRS
jgi:uncharacterized protein YqeY